MSTNSNAERADLEKAGIAIAAPATPSARMAAFDQLPRSVRQALANNAFDFSVSRVLRAWQAGQSIKSLVQEIKKAEQNLVRATAEREGRHV